MLSSWANCSGASACAWANRRTRDSDTSPAANASLVSGISSKEAATAIWLRHTAAGSPDKAISHAVVDPNPS